MYSTCEYLIKAEAEGINSDRIKFVPARTASPYSECYVQNNESDNPKGLRTVEVNHLIRYGDIFGKLLAVENENILWELKEFIFDCWIHEVQNIERITGMTKEAFFRECLIKELENNVLSDKCRQEFEVFTKKEQQYIISQIVKLYANGDNMAVFRMCIRYMFPDGYMYEYKNKYILLYPSIKKSRLTQKKIDALVNIFLPVGTKAEIFWEKHFGVIGIDNTMLLDEIELY